MKLPNSTYVLTVGATLGLALSVASCLGAKPSTENNLAEDEKTTTVSDVYDQVSGAVVNIIVTTETGETLSEGQGSGFIVSPEGDVATNYHVIEGGSTIEAEFNDGRRFPVKVIGTDEETDIALIVIDTPGRFPFVEFYDGPPLQIGEPVIAIGNPFGIGQSTSTGVISAIGRSRVDSGSFVDYIQTDATINRGNSGGPLFDMNGKVLGINSAIYSPTGASVGIAFVIPHTTAEDVISAIKRDGYVRRGYLGAATRDAVFTNESAKVFKTGAIITDVPVESPISEAGLRVDDIILEINGLPINSAKHATRVVSKLDPGTEAEITFEREEKIFSRYVEVVRRPSPDEINQSINGKQERTEVQPRSVSIDFGVHYLDISDEFKAAIGMSTDMTGIYVEAVDGGSLAARSGLRTGQIILEFNNEPVKNTRDFKSKILNMRLENDVDDFTLKVRKKNGVIEILRLQS